MTPSIERFRQIQDTIRTGRDMPADLVAWVSQGLDRFLRRQARDLDDAFGLYMGQGGVPWWREEANARRDDALRRYAALACPHLGVTARARAVAQAVRRYGSSAWLHDRHAPALPSAYTGTPKEMLWQAYKSGGPLPLGERQMRTILAE